MKKGLYVFLIGALVAACSSDDDAATTDPIVDPIVYTSGTADFSTYVSVGNSLTAGYADGALTTQGQENSLPNILSQQFALAGGGTFTQPLMADNLGGLLIGGSPLPGFENRFVMDFSIPGPKRLTGDGTTDITTVLTGSFNNMGVPGAKSYHLGVAGYGALAALPDANPYFIRFASSPTATVLGDAMGQNPTFFSLWIGANDILSYATNGGDGIDRTGNPDPSTYESNDITDPAAFQGIYQGILATLTSGGAEGVVANLPDITTIPYFTTVPHAPLSPLNEAFGPQIPTLNATFAGLNMVFDALGVPERKITFSTTAASPVVIYDEDLADLSAQIKGALMLGGLDEPTATVLAFVYRQSRQATADDLIVLPAQNAIATLNTDAFATLKGFGLPDANAGQLAVNGITWPLEDKWVLTPEEQLKVETAKNAYNVTIKNAATTFDLAFVDAEALMKTLFESGMNINGTTVSATFVSGGGFSLDGVHPSPRGYAILANAFTKAINEKYGSNLSEVDPISYTGLYFN